MDLPHDQKQIYDFLLTRRQQFVGATEISRRLAAHKRNQKDRTWARPILRRMELEGILQSNPFGEYRIRVEETKTSFHQALSMAGADLGDTTIFFLQDVEEEEPEGPEEPEASEQA